jgi:hypothetical protein
MKLRTSAGDVYFNPQQIAHVHLNGERTLLTVRFVNGTNFATELENDADRGLVADFLSELSAEQSGFLSTGNDLLNLRSALWIAVPTDGPIQIRTAENRTHVLQDKDRERIHRILGE